jgi:hypothetical protein
VTVPLLVAGATEATARSLASKVPDLSRSTQPASVAGPAVAFVAVTVMLGADPLVTVIGPTPSSSSVPVVSSPSAPAPGAAVSSVSSAAPIRTTGSLFRKRWLGAWPPLVP